MTMAIKILRAVAMGTAVATILAGLYPVAAGAFALYAFLGVGE